MTVAADSLDGDRDPVYWAAYASRIQAVRLIEEADCLMLS